MDIPSSSVSIGLAGTGDQQSLSQRVDRIGNALSNSIVTEQLSAMSQRFTKLEHQNKILEESRTSEIQRLIEAVDDLRESLKSGDHRARANDALLLLSVAKDEARYTVEQRVLNNFRFHRMDDRYSNIAKPHKNTFTWAFGTQEGVDVPLSSIAKWFLSDSDLFRVSGKPASGKSTLMKYLYNHKKTKDALRSWAAEKPAILAGFFFWYAAKDSLQKSQQGLLRSLLYQIFRQSPDAIWNVFSDLVKLPQQNHGSNLQLASLQLPTPPGTVREHIDLLQSVCTWLSKSGQRCCFFIDGLDEYEGRPSDMVRLIHTLQTIPGVKLCITSRPWNEFEEGFGKRNTYKLYMHDLTRDDIRVYVREEFAGDENYQAFEARENGAGAELIQEIIDSAQGVFL